MKNNAATGKARRSPECPIVPEYAAIAPRTGRLQQDVTEPIKPSKNAAGKTARQCWDDLKISVDHSVIIELPYFGQQAALLGVGQQATGFDARTNALYKRASLMSPDTACAEPWRPRITTP